MIRVREGDALSERHAVSRLYWRDGLRSAKILSPMPVVLSCIVP